MSVNRRPPLALLAVLSICPLGCGMGQRRLVPVRPFVTRHRVAEVSVERLHVSWSAAKPAWLVDLRVRNRGKATLRFEPKKLRLARPTGPSSRPAKSSTLKRGESSVGTGTVGGAIFGAKLGGFGGAGGGVVGGVFGAAGAVVVMAPYLIYLIGEKIVLEVKKSIPPGGYSSFSIAMSGADLEAPNDTRLLLGPALGLPAGAVPPLTVIDVLAPHGGYGPPSTFELAFALRIGGGTIFEGPTAGGVGGVDFFVGPQFGHLAIGVHMIAGIGAVGLEVRYDIRLGQWVSLVPFAGYDYYFYAGRYGLGAGHAPRSGLELHLRLPGLAHLGWRRAPLSVGVFAHAGPVFLRQRAGVGRQVQAGLAFGFF